MTKTQRGAKADAFRSLLGGAHRYPELLARYTSQIIDPLFESLNQPLRDAAERGEIAQERLTSVVLEVIHALIVKRAVLDARALTGDDVDEVLLPLVLRAVES